MSEFVRRITQLQKPINPKLGQIDIELTERCNNNCIHCCINLPANDMTARNREMTTTQVEDILKQAADLGCLQVRFTGGEPLLRPDFEEIYIIARRLGMKVLLFTNACLITRHLVDLFTRIPPRVEIEVSVYGMHVESYEAVTQTPGSFDKYLSGVNFLLENRIPFIVKGAILPHNKHEIDEFETWAKTIPWMTHGPNYSMSFDLRNRRDDEEKNSQIESLRLSPKEELKVLTRDEKKYRKDVAEFALKFMGSYGDELFNCGAGHGVCIDAYGFAQPCMGIRSQELTFNVIEKNGHTSSGVTDRSLLHDALSQFSHLSELRATNPEYLRRCAQCFLKGFCEQCPAKSWAEYGTLDAPVDYLCEMAHAQAIYLGWLRENESGWGVRAWRERVKKTIETSVYNQ
jgi:radical SAM protein with 4Fe4S-binding SPASM domain